MQSEMTDRVYVAPGNGGTGGMARNVDIEATDVVRLAKFVKRESIDLAVLGPEAAVAAGVGDALRDCGSAVFGPGRDAGRIESSKTFAKDVMRAAGIPTADHEAFTEAEPARRWARERDGRVAVKADGLTQGKGVTVCSTPEEADQAIDSMLVQGAFGAAGRNIVVEARLQGPEVSVFGISDGTSVVALQPARDFKRARDGDEGPNTGGMGAYSPPQPASETITEQALDMVLQPAITELATRGLEYRGVLYAGLMQAEQGLHVLEFNARFGDPEAQVLLPRLQSDLVALMLAAARGDLASYPQLRWDERPAVGVVVASGGYPEAYQTGFEIEGLTSIPPGVMVFHAATRYEPGRGLVTSGGRVLTSVGMGDTLEDARLTALSGAVRVRFPGAFYRTDIARERV